VSSFICSILVVCVVQFKFFLSSHMIAWPVILGLLASFLILFLVVPLAIAVVHSKELEGVIVASLSSVKFHILWPTVFALAFIPDFLVILRRNGVFGSSYNVSDVMQLQRQESQQRRSAARRTATVAEDQAPSLRRRRPSRVADVDA
jgi:glucan phosphoethanolaminetransferase (alkaline phosphatase superfamily)